MEGSALPLGQERVLVVGGGSLGSVYAGRLGAAGVSVQLLGRPAQVAAINRTGGITITGREAVRGAVRAVSDPAAVRPADVLILLTKTYDTREALSHVAHVRDHLRVAISLQNGLDKNALMSSWVGRDVVIGGASMVGATLEQPGVVAQTFHGPTLVGELAGGRSERVERLAHLLADAGLETVVADDIHSVEWSKVLQVLPAQSVTALTRRYYHEALTVPGLARAFARLLREGAAVARADGADLLEWDGVLPIRAIADSELEEAVVLLQDYGESRRPASGPGAKPSMLQSIERRALLEVESMQGEVLRRAERYGLCVPTVAAVYNLLSGLDELHRRERGENP